MNQQADISGIMSDLHKSQATRKKRFQRSNSSFSEKKVPAVHLRRLPEIQSLSKTTKPSTVVGQLSPALTTPRKTQYNINCKLACLVISGRIRKMCLRVAARQIDMRMKGEKMGKLMTKLMSTRMANGWSLIKKGNELDNAKENWNERNLLLMSVLKYILHRQFHIKIAIAFRNILKAFRQLHQTPQLQSISTPALKKTNHQFLPPSHNATQPIPPPHCTPRSPAIGLTQAVCSRAPARMEADMYRKPTNKPTFWKVLEQTHSISCMEDN